jgi:AcrR family transcriptional regulator
VSQARPYHSPRRELGAAATRRDLLRAARRLFADRGYARVTVADIAREAGTAVKTMYASVGGKAEILREILEEAVKDSGAEETTALILTLTDPLECLRELARGTRLGYEAHREVLAILASAMPVLDSADALWNRVLASYQQGLGAVAVHLAELGAVSISPDRGADLLWFCFGPQAWRALVEDSGWTWDDAQAQLTATARALLLETISP